MRPGDINPESGNRLPPVDRDRLDDAARTLYDEVARDARSLAGFRGPAGITMHSPRLYAINRPVNQFLRFGSGIEPRLRELAILVAAREMDSHFEWHAHEVHAKSEGVADNIVDIIRKRKSVRGLDERDAVIIKLGREAIRKHRVKRSTYAKAIEVFGDEMLVNLVALIGAYVATALSLAVFAQELPDGATSSLD